MFSDEEAEEIREQLLEQLDNLPEEQQEQAETLKKQIKSANNEQLEQFVRAQQKQHNDGENECIFCQIIEGKLDTIKIYEDSDIIAILDVYPASVGHMLVMPKQHLEKIENISDVLLNKLFVFVKSIMPVFLKVTGAKAANVFVAQGDEAGQRVKHFCINLIPRYGKDKVSFEWNKLKADKKELEKLGEKLRKEAAREIGSKLEVEREKIAKVKKKEEEDENEKIMRHVKRRMP